MVTKLFPNVIEFASDFPQAIIDTLLMLVISGLISVVIGILLAVIVVVTRKDGLKENQPVFWILDKIINLFRSIPFIILIPTVAVLSRALFGTTIGIEGALVPLVIGTAPFVARQDGNQPLWKLIQESLKQVLRWDSVQKKLSLMFI